MRQRGSNNEFSRQRDRIQPPESRMNNDFAFTANRPMDYGSWETLSGGVSGALGDLRERLEEALISEDPKRIRDLSKHFFKISGVYARTARYISLLPLYENLVVPVVLKEGVEKGRILSEMNNVVNFTDRLKLKTVIKEMVLKVIVEGAYFGYLRSNAGKFVMQDLPNDYCRTRYKVNGFPVVEFNVKYFDAEFPLKQVLIKVLNSYPPEIVEGYAKYKRGEIKEKFEGKNSGGAWVALDPDNAIAFYYDESLRPLLSSAFFAILDTLELKGIEKRKAEEQLFNLIVQKVPLTKDGEFIFDVEEAKAMHTNAAAIFKGTQKSDVLTTFADIENVDLGDTSDPIDLETWGKDVWSELGVSSQLFSTEGNLALEKSIVVDEALIFYLVEKIETWLNHQIDIRFNRARTKYYFKIWFPPITQNNKFEMFKNYKELATLGYSKFLPALALGQSQLSLMSLAMFENDLLNLNSIMEPLRSSHTASAKEGGGAGGRPPKPDSEKSDKTIQNQNSQ